ncbi:hypothetical protein ACTVMM_08540, partial [Serratia ureilytica]
PGAEPGLIVTSHHYFDKLPAGNRADEEKLAYYRQMTATARPALFKTFPLNRCIIFLSATPCI